MISIVSAVSNREVFQRDLQPTLPAIEFLPMYDYTNVSLALNDGIEQASNDIVCCVHQDVKLPSTFLEDVERAISSIGQFGALGVAGITFQNQFLLNLNDRGSHFKQLIGIYERVRVLDEVLMIIDRRHGIRFDTNIPYHHLYGVDICLQFNKIGVSNFVIDTYPMHNSSQGSVLPDEFHQCVPYIRSKWINDLPIYTTCIQIA